MSKTDIETIKKTFTNYTQTGEHGYKHFAVLIPVVRQNDEACLAYEVRAKGLDRQPGEICFPGGMIEDGEAPLECVLRETEEELGINELCVEIITRFDSVYTGGGSQIHCFIGIIEEKAFACMRPNEDEVAEVFTVSIDTLLGEKPEMYYSTMYQEPDPFFPYDKVTDGNEYPWRNGKVPVPVFEVPTKLIWKSTGSQEGTNSEDNICCAEQNRIIWGLTGRMTKQFLEVLKCSN